MDLSLPAAAVASNISGHIITFLVTLYHQTTILGNFTHLTNIETRDNLGAKGSKYFVLFVQGLSEISALSYLFLCIQCFEQIKLYMYVHEIHAHFTSPAG